MVRIGTSPRKGGDLLAGGEGVGGPNSDEGTDTLVRIYVILPIPVKEPYAEVFSTFFLGLWTLAEHCLQVESNVCADRKMKVLKIQEIRGAWAQQDLTPLWI